MWFPKKQIQPTLSPNQNLTTIHFGFREYCLKTAPSGILLHLMAKLHKIQKSIKGLELKKMPDTKWNGFLISKSQNSFRILVSLRDDHIGMAVQYLSIYYYPLPSDMKTAREKLLVSQIIFILHKSILSFSTKNLKVFTGIQCVNSTSRKFCSYNKCMNYLIHPNQFKDPIINGIYIFDILPEVHKHSLTIPWEENKLIEKFLSISQENGNPIYKAQFNKENILVTTIDLPKSIISNKQISKYKKFLNCISKLYHINLIRVYFTILPSLNAVIEYFPNCSLFSYLQNENEISLEYLLYISLDIIDSIIFLHSQNPPIQHGGINLRSILLLQFVNNNNNLISSFHSNVKQIYAKLSPCEFEYFLSNEKQATEDLDLLSFTKVLHEMIQFLKPNNENCKQAHNQLKLLISVLNKTDPSHIVCFSWIKGKLLTILHDYHNYDVIMNDSSPPKYHDIFLDSKEDFSKIVELFKSYLDSKNIVEIIKILKNGFPLWSDEFDFSCEFGKLLIELINENSSLILRQVFECGCFHPNCLLLDESKNNNNYLIHYATKENAIRCLEVLLLFGASPNSSSNLKETAMHIAVTSTKSLEMSKLLLEFRADPWIENIYGSSSVMRACTLTSGCVPLFLSIKSPKNAINIVLLRSLILQYHKQESIVLEQIVLLFAQGAILTNENIIGHEYLGKFVEEIVQSLLFSSPTNIIPVQHLLWGLRSFFNYISDESFERIQNNLITSMFIKN